jgi:hypothetical protein
VNLGPLAVGTNGSVRVAVGTPGASDDRLVSLWTS